MIILSRDSSPAERWLAHLLRVAEGSVRAGDPFDDGFRFESEAVLALARRHRVAPLLYEAVRLGRIADALPATFVEGLATTTLGTARKNAITTAVGRELLEALAERGVAAAPLKGWAFIEGTRPLYADPSLRPMDDLDVMVAREDRARAMHVLAALGFERATHGAALVGGHEVAFYRHIAGVNCFVELHWSWAGSESLLRDFAMPGRVFLERFCEPATEPPGARLPTWLGHVLFGAVHGARHAFERWIWLVDLHRLLTCEPVDWPGLLASARAWRLRGPLYVGLLASRELLRTPVPKEILHALAPGALRRRLLHRSLASSVRSAGGRRAARVAKLLLGETWWDVARTAAWAARPGEAWYAARGETPPAGGAWSATRGGRER